MSTLGFATNGFLGGGTGGGDVINYFGKIVADVVPSKISVNIKTSKISVNIKTKKITANIKRKT